MTGYSYDTLDRVTQVTFNDGSTITFSYDAANRITQITDSVSGSISYAFDNLDRVVTETTSQGAVSYTYDAVGRRTSVSIPGQPVINYSYDNADRLIQVTQGSSTVTFNYDNANRRTSMTQANGVVTEYSYDSASRLIGLTYKKGTNVLGNLSYEYDSVGRRIKVGGSFARTGLPQTVSSAAYNAANHQQTFGSQSLTFDLNGNLTSDGTNAYAWNARDQLIGINGPGLAASFQYDAVGRRASKTVNGISTSFLYDGVNAVRETVGGGGTSATTLTVGIDRVLTRSDSSGTTSMLMDALGSTLALTDSAGTVQTEYTYEPFGKTATTGTSNNNPSQYSGRENDGTGLYYFRARYYSPTLQRFISEDPIGTAGGINLYAYVGNDPINLADPLGLKPKGTAAPNGNFRPADYGFNDGFVYNGRPYWVQGSGRVVDGDGNFVGWTPEPGTPYAPEDIIALVSFGQGLVALAQSTAALGSAGVRIASSSGGEFASATIVRTIAKGESIQALMEEAKAITFTTGKEVAVVSLKDGGRALITGGSGGISELEALGVKRVLGHTHPYGVSGPVVPSAKDLTMLEQLGQTHSYILERGTLTRFGRP